MQKAVNHAKFSFIIQFALAVIIRFSLFCVVVNSKADTFNIQNLVTSWSFNIISNDYACLFSVGTLQSFS